MDDNDVYGRVGRYAVRRIRLPERAVDRATHSRHARVGRIARPTPLAPRPTPREPRQPSRRAIPSESEAVSNA